MWHLFVELECPDHLCFCLRREVVKESQRMGIAVLWNFVERIASRNFEKFGRHGVVLWEGIATRFLSYLVGMEAR